MDTQRHEGLRGEGIHAEAEEAADLQVLISSVKKQCGPPAGLIDIGHGLALGLYRDLEPATSSRSFWFPGAPKAPSASTPEPPGRRPGLERQTNPAWRCGIG